MIIILSTTTTFLLIHKHKHYFKKRRINFPFLKSIKKYIFVFSEKKQIIPEEIEQDLNNIENVKIEKDKEKIKVKYLLIQHFEKEEKTDLWFYSFKWSFIFS
ncbi:hypothetical protein [Plasmodium yoelii yoelii]|uniref:Uncharacterized protein n=1 Tax=Plasmodium yoelii yoelii TaxID=73239 RepID=Q7RBL7_PLAYO|nr:hypothetical protein [Plasmodium yoelii yoelii]